MMPLAPFLLLALLACSVEKAGPRPAGGGPQASAEIAAFWNRYAAAQKAADTTAWKALVTEDAVFTFTGAETLRGRDRATALLASFLAEHAVAAMHVSSEEVTVAGDRAFQLARVHEAYHPRNAPGPVTEEFSRMGAFLTRTGDGRWLLDRVVIVTDSTVTR